MKLFGGGIKGQTPPRRRGSSSSSRPRTPPPRSPTPATAQGGSTTHGASSPRMNYLASAIVSSQSSPVASPHHVPGPAPISPNPGRGGGAGASSSPRPPGRPSPMPNSPSLSHFRTFSPNPFATRSFDRDDSSSHGGAVAGDHGHGHGHSRSMTPSLLHLDSVFSSPPKQRGRGIGRLGSGLGLVGRGASSQRRRGVGGTADLAVDTGGGGGAGPPTTPPRLVTPDRHHLGDASVSVEERGRREAEEAEAEARRRRREDEERQRQLLALAAELEAKEGKIASLKEEGEERRKLMDEAQEELTRLRAKLQTATAAEAEGEEALAPQNGTTGVDDDLITLDAAYVERLAEQVGASRRTHHRLERQLPFVKGCCDHVVEILRDRLAEVERDAATTEARMLNDLSLTSTETVQLEANLRDRLDTSTAKLVRLERELSEAERANGELRDALTNAESAKAAMERDMINQLTVLSHEKEMIEEDLGANLRCKEETLASLRETTRAMYANYRSSGLFPPPDSDEYDDSLGVTNSFAGDGKDDESVKSSSSTCSAICHEEEDPADVESRLQAHVVDQLRAARDILRLSDEFPAQRTEFSSAVVDILQLTLHNIVSSSADTTTANERRPPRGKAAADVGRYRLNEVRDGIMSMLDLASQPTIDASGSGDYRMNGNGTGVYTAAVEEVLVRALATSMNVQRRSLDQEFHGF